LIVKVGKIVDVKDDHGAYFLPKNFIGNEPSDDDSAIIISFVVHSVYLVANITRPNIVALHDIHY
jgi:hypothetical protein